MMRTNILRGVAIFAALTLLASVAVAETRTENFDTKPATWIAEGVGSAHSTTNFAGGAAGGEAVIQPVQPGKCIMADTSIGSLNLSQSFEASGKVIWRINNAPSTRRGIHLGFFDKNSYSTFVGLGFHGNANARAFVIHDPSAGVAPNVVKQAAIGQVPTGPHSAPNNDQPLAFKIQWDSAAGRLTVELEGLGSQSITLSDTERSNFTSSLNAFGFFVPDATGANGSQFFADDLSYTVNSSASFNPGLPKVPARTAGLPVGSPNGFGEDRPEPGNMPKPDLAYFFTPDQPLEDPDTLLFNYDAPCLTNHWMFIQAANNANMQQGILNTEDIFLGGDGPVEGIAQETYRGFPKAFYQPLIVRIDGVPLVPDQPLADWFPDRKTPDANMYVVALPEAPYATRWCCGTMATRCRSSR